MMSLCSDHRSRDQAKHHSPWQPYPASSHFGRLGTFGEHEAYDLSAEHNNAAYLPRGIAHGFFVRSAPAMVVYEVTSEHSPEYDTGIRWDSFGAIWPQSAPVISLRDESLIPFAQFKSPFRFDADMASSKVLKR
jgi:dTDP-4-dehydrorhamnose 3,5-epimerase